MLHKSTFKPNPLPKECSSANSVSNTKWHPLSYYLNGGIDLTGDALDNSAEVEYDNEEEYDAINEEGAMSVPYGDPKMSKFRLVEQYGAKEAQLLASKSAKGTVVDGTKPE